MNDEEKAYYNRFMDKWDRSDFHLRGCMLEGLAQDLWRLPQELVKEILRGIAARMK